MRIYISKREAKSDAASSLYSAIFVCLTAGFYQFIMISLEKGEGLELLFFINLALYSLMGSSSVP